MAEGTVLTQGTMEEIRANDEVIEAYLGGGGGTGNASQSRTEPADGEAANP